MEQIVQYFPGISEEQAEQFSRLKSLYEEWNAQINVISRKDMDAFYTHHVLHSLGIAKVQEFLPGARVLDVGTGGGFPGIPLAILFPQTQFHLADSIGKKIKVVDAVASALGLTNVKTTHGRVETIREEFDFIVSRAVTTMPEFVRWVRDKIAKDSSHTLRNGILYLKGGDLSQELAPYTGVKLFDLKDYFEDEFFDTKKVVYLPMKKK